MSINFPVVPLVAGVPAVQAFPGIASIAGSIAGNLLTVTDGIGAIAPGLALAGAGISAGTVLTSGLTSIIGGSAFATVNIAQSVAAMAIGLSGSLSGLLGDVGGLLGGDTVDAQVGAGAGVRWGVYLNGALVVEPDSVISLDYKKDWHISDYPVEQGSFESYNKVRLPFEVRVMMTMGGTETERNAFLSTIEDISDSYDLYDVVTPDFTYVNANITHFDYRRTAENGVSLIAVTLWLQEVRLEASSEFTETAQPGSADQVNGGTVQTQDVTPAEQDTFESHGATGSW